MTEILYIIALSLGSIVALFILTKIMGYRQMSQMSMFDYINGITIGSIAAEMATSLENNFMELYEMRQKIGEISSKMKLLGDSL